MTRDGKGTISLAGLEPGDYVRLEYVRSDRGLGASVAADPFFFRASGSRLFRSTYVVAAPEGLGLAVDAHGMEAPALAREARTRGAPRGGARRTGPRARAEPAAARRDPPARAGRARAATARRCRRISPTCSPRPPARPRSSAPSRAGSAPTRGRTPRPPRSRAPPGPASRGRSSAARAATTRSRRARACRAAAGAGSSSCRRRSRSSGVRARVALARPFGADALAAPVRVARRVPAPAPPDRGGRRDDSGTTPRTGSRRSARCRRRCSGSRRSCSPRPASRSRWPARRSAPPSRTGASSSCGSRCGRTAAPRVEGEDRYFGASAAMAKAAVERLDASERRQVVEGTLARTFRGVSLASAEMLGEDDPAAPFTLRWRGTVPGLARAANGGLVVDAPLLAARLGARYVQVAARTAPLLVGVPETVAQRVEIVAPEGFAPARPRRRPRLRRRSARSPGPSGRGADARARGAARAAARARAAGPVRGVRRVRGLGGPGAAAPGSPLRAQVSRAEPAGSRHPRPPARERAVNPRGATPPPEAPGGHARCTMDGRAPRSSDCREPRPVHRVRGRARFSLPRSLHRRRAIAQWSPPPPLRRAPRRSRDA